MPSKTVAGIALSAGKTFVFIPVFQKPDTRQRRQLKPNLTQRVPSSSARPHPHGPNHSTRHLGGHPTSPSPPPSAATPLGSRAVSPTVCAEGQSHFLLFDYSLGLSGFSRYGVYTDSATNKLAKNPNPRFRFLPFHSPNKTHQLFVLKPVMCKVSSKRGIVWFLGTAVWVARPRPPPLNTISSRRRKRIMHALRVSGIKL
ncbi:hypothetical protein JTE90_025379 [Oedothorax gibbosus]|uniref:Uncharacterized protein n=1 Tax=Oedothorax gibbosus TaxID=931172 RepID=A0AAV6TPG8_9ARAC|nr:hypothetical protein JTE90_025379 [Oedothorax gibbosus]